MRRPGFVSTEHVFTHKGCGAMTAMNRATPWSAAVQPEPALLYCVHCGEFFAAAEFVPVGKVG